MIIKCDCGRSYDINLINDSKQIIEKILSILETNYFLNQDNETIIMYEDIVKEIKEEFDYE